VDLEEWRTHPARYNDFVPPEWLTEHNKARLIIPLIHRDELISFLVLGEPRIPLRLDWELLDLLKTVARQAAGYIAEQEAAAALSDARKMEEFNKRSAFIVHDVKNLVGQLSLLEKNAESHGSRPEFQKDMLETVQNTIQGMNKLLRQFKQQTAPKNIKTGEQNYAQLFSDQARKWRAKTGELNIVAAKNSDRIMVNADDIQSVLDHLMMNACEAAGPAGVVDLTFDIGPSEYLIEIRDNGPGMDQDFVRNQLFRPFQSGKGGGMGMGAYQVREMIRGMGGRLEVDSVPDNGTAMRIFIPLSQCDDVQNDRV
jgi:putative PEP-CTERM system histidine kinase